MKWLLLSCWLMGLAWVCNEGENSEKEANKEETKPLPSCEWCGAMDAPPNPEPIITIPPPDEPGEPLIISGTVYESDQQTPAADILIYVYHTNAEGIYPTTGNETGNGRRHGYLRGWMETDENGYYEFRTIKPVPYPSRSEAAHIHITLSGPGFEEYWIDSYKFEGDPLLTESEKGEENVIELHKDEQERWRGERNIILREVN